MFNKYLLSIILFLSTFFFISMGYADQDNKAIQVSQNQPQFTVQLPANLTTGYSWFLGQYDEQLIEVVSYYYEKPTKTMPGAGGNAVWIFKVKPRAFVAPHRIVIQMFYMQPWNASQAQEKKVIVVTH
ncbi:MAG: protease inhibitor I42 family protein [Proteobacteria bacterium]|nr:protease inhibitor I42 family protein [Pseudomonadota bacterium]